VSDGKVAQKESFVELRAEGLSYSAIAEKLSVSKPTLIAWGKELESQVHNARTLRMDQLFEKFAVAKSKRVVPIDFRVSTISIRVEAVPEHGMATIWDADVLIWAASQIVEARDAGLKTSRLMAATPTRF